MPGGIPLTAWREANDRQVKARALPPKEGAPTHSVGLPGLRAPLIALASLAAFAVPVTCGAARLDPEDVERDPVHPENFKQQIFRGIGP